MQDTLQEIRRALQDTPMRAHWARMQGQVVITYTPDWEQEIASQDEAWAAKLDPLMKQFGLVPAPGGGFFDEGDLCHPYVLAG